MHNEDTEITSRLKIYTRVYVLCVITSIAKVELFTLIIWKFAVFYFFIFMYSFALFSCLRDAHFFSQTSSFSSQSENREITEVFLRRVFLYAEFRVIW